jgi:hypothetical protein
LYHKEEPYTKPPPPSQQQKRKKKMNALVFRHIYTMMKRSAPKPLIKIVFKNFFATYVWLLKNSHYDYCINSSNTYLLLTKQTIPWHHENSDDDDDDDDAKWYDALASCLLWSSEAEMEMDTSQQRNPKQQQQQLKKPQKWACWVTQKTYTN